MTNHTTKFFAILALVVTVTATPARGESSTKKTADKMADNEPPKMIGLELGTFLLKDYRPIQGEKVRLSFKLYAATPVENKKRFMRLLERHQMQVRDQVITAMRLAEPAEFEDPKLRLIRRRLGLRLGRALPELAIKEVYFGEFRYMVD